MSEPEVIAGVADRDLTGQTALVTGSTSGIGREAALALGRLGADVMVHGRDEAAGESVVAELDRLGVDARFVRADFTDLDAVRRLAEAAGEFAHDGLDVVAHNAGGYFREGRVTEAGIEQTFQVNHLASYLLTAELLDTLAPEARVVVTSSAAHRGDPIDESRLTTVENYSGWRAYQRSKLANVLFTTELARRLPDGRVNAFHPGMIPGSGFLRFLPGPVSKLGGLAGRLPGLATPADGAATLVYLAAGVSVSGRYFADCAPRTPADVARDPEAARRLWETSAALLDVPEPLADRPATADD